MAAPNNLVAPLELVDYGIASNTSAVTFTRTQAYLDPSDYDGATYYFEVDGYNNHASINYSPALYYWTGSVWAAVTSATVSVPHSTSAYTRLRSGVFTPQAGQTAYCAFLPATALANNLRVNAARIVVGQASATKTRIQIPLYSVQYNSTSSADTSSQADGGHAGTGWGPIVGKQVIFPYSAAAWATVSGATSCSIEAVLESNSASYTAYAALFDVTDTDFTTPIGQVSTVATSWTLLNADFNVSALTDGRTYQLAIKSSNASGACYLARAALCLRVTSLAACEIWWRIAQYLTATSSATELSYQLAKIDLSLYSGFGNAYLEADGASNNDATCLQINDQGTNEHGGTVAELTPGINFNSATYARQRTTAVSLTDGHRYDAYVNAETNTTTVGAAFIVLQYSLSLISAAVATSWTARAAVVGSVAASWFTRALKSASSCASWIVTQVTLESLLKPLTWFTRSSRTRPLSVSWYLRSTVAPLKAASSWTTKVLVVAWPWRGLMGMLFGARIRDISNVPPREIAVLWGVRNAVTRSLRSTWTTKAARVRQLTSSWTTRSARGIVAAVSWRSRLSRAISASSSWATRGGLAPKAAVSWITYNAVRRSLSASWFSRLGRSTSAGVSWTARGWRAISSGSSWITKVRLAPAKAATWTIRAAAAQSISLTWFSRLTVAPVGSVLTWLARASRAAAPRAVSYVVTFATGLVTGRATSWTVRNRATASRSSAWFARASAAAANFPAAWLSRVAEAAVSTEHALAWRVRATVRSSKATSWRAANRVTPSAPLAWFARATVARASAPLSWFARATMAAAKRPASWTSRGALLVARPSSWVAHSLLGRPLTACWRIAGHLAAATPSAWFARSSRAMTRPASWVARLSVARRVAPVPGRSISC